jgi:hypothetical protein
MNDMVVVFLEDTLIRVFFNTEEKDYFRRKSYQFPSTPYFCYVERGTGGAEVDWGPVAKKYYGI